jgi:hypothetical protein
MLAALGVTAPGQDLLRSLIAVWPGVAILRDAQQFVAPLALAEAVGLGLAVAAALNPGPLARTAPRHPGPFSLIDLNPERSAHADKAGAMYGVPRPDRPGRTDTAGIVLDVPEAERPARATLTGLEAERPARAAAAVLRPERPSCATPAGIVLAVIALMAPVLLLPGLAWGAAGRLQPVWYPAAWLAAARTLDASPAPGSVLLLPWATYRAPPWNHGEVVLDPWTRLLSRTLIWNDGTQVGDVALAPDDSRARALASAIAAGGPLTATLRAAGVRFVLDDPDGPGPQVAARLPGSVVIIDLPGLTVYQLPG